MGLKDVADKLADHLPRKWGDIAKNLVAEHLGTDAFDSTVKQHMSSLGVEDAFEGLVENVEKAYDLQHLKGAGGISDVLKKLGSGVAAHYAMVGGAWAAGLVTTGTATALGGPAGAAVSIILEEAAAEAIKAFAGSSAATYAQGDWVQIDNGSKVVDVQTKRLAEGMWGSMFQDFPDEIEWDMTTEEDYSLGFVVDTTGDHVTVYNFAYNKEQTKDPIYLRAVSDKQRALMEANATLRSLKQLRLSLDALEGVPLLCSPVNTDPGTEVWLDDTRFSIIQCIGSAALIEGDAGDQRLVDVHVLRPGAAAHGRAYNYRSDGSVTDGGFITEGGSGLAQGQFVWVPPTRRALERYDKAQLLLACITFVEGSSVKCVSALDGEELLQFDAGAVLPVNEEIRETLNSWADFVAFREAATTGYALKRKAPGNWHPEVCLGIGVIGELTASLKLPQAGRAAEVCTTGLVPAHTPGWSEAGAPLGGEGMTEGDMEDVAEEITAAGGDPSFILGGTPGLVAGAPLSLSYSTSASVQVNYAVLLALVAGAGVVVYCYR